MLKRTDLNELVSQMQQESGLTKTKFSEVSGVGCKQNLNKILNKARNGKYAYKIGFNLFESICNKMGYDFSISIEKKDGESK